MDELRSINGGKIMDHGAFDLWGEDEAYFAGVLATDGCVSDNNNISLGVHRDDYPLVKSLKDFLKSEHKINFGKKKPSVALSFTSERIASILSNVYQVTPRKTFTLQPPWHLYTRKPELVKHFLLGAITGDGTIGFTGKDNRVLRLRLYSASKEFLDWVLEYYMTIIPEFKGSVCLKKDKRPGRAPYYVIAVSAATPDSPNFKLIEHFREISRDHMERKWNKVDQFIEMHNG